MRPLVPIAALLTGGLTARAGVEPCELSDAGRPLDRGGPTALVVASPGVDTIAYGALVEALQAQGMDAWVLSFPVEAQDPRRMVHGCLPAAVEVLSPSSWVLVGHGLGGTLAAQAVIEGAVIPDALALLGAPLRFLPQALTRWLADQPVPPLGVHLGQAGDLTWNGRHPLDVLLGEPLPPLLPVSGAWLADLASRVDSQQALTLEGVGVPSWVGVGSLDNLAPPEAVRSQVGEATFVRFGYNRLDPREYDNAALLIESRPMDALARWSISTLRGGISGRSR